MIQQHGKLYWSLKPHPYSGQPEFYAGLTPSRLTTGWESVKTEIIGTKEWSDALTKFAEDFPSDISTAWADHASAAEMLNRHSLAATGTPVYLRFGNLPKSGYSINHATGETEPGISVYEGRRVGNNKYYLMLSKVNAGSALFIAQGRQAHVVTGDIVGYGSDGEKCLKNCQTRKLSNKVEIIPVV